MAGRRSDRFLFGWALPIAIQAIGMLLIANLDSGASAAEFAGLAVFFMLLFTLPLTAVLNLAFVLAGDRTRRVHFARDMVLPAVFLAAALIYQSGLWDRMIETALFPSPFRKLRLFSSTRITEDTYRWNAVAFD